MRNIQFKYGVLFFLLGSLLIFACKKDKSDHTKKYLSKIYKNGLLEVEYLYNAEKKPYRRNKYSVTQGQSTYNGFRLYSYDSEGRMIRVESFDKGSEIQDQTTLIYGVNGELTRVNEADENGIVHSYFTYQYNTDGTVASVFLKDADNNKVVVENLFFYNGNKLLTKWLRTNLFGNVLKKNDSTLFTPRSGFPDHWSYFETKLGVAVFPGFDTYFTDMFTDSSFYYRYDAPPQIVNISYSNRVQEGNYPINYQQTIKSQSVGPVITSNTQFSIEYINL